ncbi:hypothetical protein ACNAN0_10230 [Agrilactobacillus fermenti]|uniref:hypothetical protein n=1 Tax=Agrilactobacillus fermenti TaxID=2586909 RepID=UPI003A5C6B08
MKLLGKRHFIVAFLLLVLYGLLIYFERAIILNSNATPDFLLLLYLVAGLILAVLAVTFYRSSFDRTRPKTFTTRFLSNPQFYITLLFLALVVMIQIITAWLQTKALVPAFGLQKQVSQLTGLEIWSFRLFYVVLIPLIQQPLLNSVAFSELFHSGRTSANWLALFLVALLTACYSGQNLGLLFALQFILGLCYSSSFLATKNLVAPTLIQIISHLVFVILYA